MRRFCSDDSFYSRTSSRQDGKAVEQSFHRSAGSDFVSRHTNISRHARPASGQVGQGHPYVAVLAGCIMTWVSKWMCGRFFVDVTDLSGGDVRCCSRWPCRCRRCSTSVCCCSSSCSSTPCSACSSSCTSSTRQASTSCSTSRLSGTAWFFCFRPQRQPAGMAC